MQPTKAEQHKSRKTNLAAFVLRLPSPHCLEKRASRVAVLLVGVLWIEVFLILRTDDSRQSRFGLVRHPSVHNFMGSREVVRKHREENRKEEEAHQCPNLRRARCPFKVHEEHHDDVRLDRGNSDRDQIVGIVSESVVIDEVADVHLGHRNGQTHENGENGGRSDVHSRWVNVMSVIVCV